MYNGVFMQMISLMLIKFLYIYGCGFDGTPINNYIYKFFFSLLPIDDHVCTVYILI